MTTIGPILTVEKLREARTGRYRQRQDLKVRTEAEALAFLNDTGLCLLFSAKEIELPSLWGALCGENRPLPSHHDDQALGLAWQWKDTLPTSGRILIGGADVTHRPPYGRPVNTVFQDYALFPHMTVAQNVAFGPRMQRWSRLEASARVEELLALVEREIAAMVRARWAGDARLDEAVEQVRSGARDPYPVAEALAGVGLTAT